MNIGRDTFLALSTIIWATGEVAPTSAAALMEAARVCGLEGSDLVEIERSTRERLPLDSVGPLAPDHADSVFAYGLATWLARANDMLIESEKRALEVFGDLLGISRGERNRAAAAAHSIRVATDGRIDHDVMALARELRRTSS